MSDLVEIIVSPTERVETARRLLTAAETAGVDARSVRTGGLGSFFVPAEVAAAAGLGDSPAETEADAAEEAVSRSKRTNRGTGNGEGA